MILHKGLEHRRVLASAEGPGTDSLWIPRGDWAVFPSTYLTKELRKQSLVNVAPDRKITMLKPSRNSREQNVVFYYQTEFFVLSF